MLFVFAVWLFTFLISKYNFNGTGFEVMKTKLPNSLFNLMIPPARFRRVPQMLGEQMRNGLEIKDRTYRFRVRIPALEFLFERSIVLFPRRVAHAVYTFELQYDSCSLTLEY